MSKMKLIMENWKKFIKEEEAPFPPMEPRADSAGGTGGGASDDYATHSSTGEPLLKSLTPRADAPSYEGDHRGRQLYIDMLDEIRKVIRGSLPALMKIFTYEIFKGQKGEYFQLNFGSKGNEILNSLGTRELIRIRNLPYSNATGRLADKPDEFDPEGYSSQFDGTKGYWSYKYK